MEICIHLWSAPKWNQRPWSQHRQTGRLHWLQGHWCNRGRGSISAGCLPHCQGLRRCGQIRIRSSCAPDRDLTAANTAERAKTTAKLGTLLGSKQSNPRGKDACQPSEDTFSAGNVSKQLLYCDKAPPGASEYGKPEVESEL